MKKVLVLFGTRPEAIKLAPVIRQLSAHREDLNVRICVTGQHQEMLYQVLEFFSITPHHDLKVMSDDQGLNELSRKVLQGVQRVLHEEKPDLVVVQGDTTTAMAGAMAAFYEGIAVHHVEAGLRTFNNKAPFPEEANRQIISTLADEHYAPTQLAADNLLRQGADEDHVHVTGNTVIDALHEGLSLLDKGSFKGIEKLKRRIDPDKKLILVTGHRRENFGKGFANICKALLSIAEDPDVQILYPVHLNPNVQYPVQKYLGKKENILLLDPLPYPEFIWLMNQSYLILTDSGGLQEEAPSLGKPVLVMRRVTERKEAVEAGTVILVGTDNERIVAETRRLLDDEAHYERMSALHNPYGDGKAAGRIAQIICDC